MRINPFIDDLRKRFDLAGNEAAARVFADAMNATSPLGSHEFEYDGVEYVMTATWYDSCIGGDCNPATCYTSWSLDAVTPGE